MYLLATRFTAEVWAGGWDSALEELLSSGFPGDEGSRGFPGDEASQGGDAAQEGRSPTVTDGSPAHRSPVPSMEAGPCTVLCGGCGGRVSDRVILLAAGRVWHGACLRCSLCQCELQSHASLYCRDGKIYCQHDYCRLFSVGRCARCSQPIPSSALVMRSGALTFHPHCFSCQECDVTLLPGNLYCARGRSLYCQSHYQADGRARPPGPDQLRQTDREGEGEESVSSPEPRLEDGAAGGRARGRTKRIRTCFRSEQLRAMESYFALKHNPDGKDWTCLSHRTGLPKRVLQVWFQNARAKLRRSLPADDSQSNSPAAMATMPASMATSQPSQALQTSTIDQLELSLLTAPLSDTPQSPIGQPRGYKDSFLLDYNSQSPPRLSPLMTLDFGEASSGREGDCNKTPQQYYC
ncbi:LIM/homeobox protein Lhx9-like [Conger conger]|uniref:LIM/homeobox protein Lhx9-like n=1 Tax=Conger conger TaxID=82655 RepID=UPI002A5A27C5|nr:LIM/homeobox protein Lhx9-like [Conger conger]